MSSRQRVVGSVGEVTDVGSTVLGLGITAPKGFYHLARGGGRPDGVDQFTSTHPRASSRAFSLDGNRPVLTSRSGAIYRCNRLVVAPGPWAPRLLSDCEWSITFTRQYTAYFGTNKPSTHSHPHAPVFGDRFNGIYCLPRSAGGIKVASDRPGPATTLEDQQPQACRDRLQMLKECLSKVLPTAAETALGSCRVSTR